MERTVRNVTGRKASLRETKHSPRELPRGSSQVNPWSKKKKLSINLIGTYSDLYRLALDVHADLELEVIHERRVNLHPLVLERGHSVRGDWDFTLLNRGLGLFAY